MVTRLADGVWWCDMQGVNAYVVDDDDLTLVDTGMPWQGGPLVDDLQRITDTLADIDRVLITHFDFDHVGGLSTLADHGLDAPVYIGVDDEPFLAGREKPSWRNRKGLFQRMAEFVRSDSPLAVETVADGEKIGAFTAYHTPGHTPGHTAFVHEDRSVALVGDLVRETDGTFAVPPWFLNHDQHAAEESLTSFVDRAPAVDIVCPGHGTPCTDDGSKRLAVAAGERATP